MQNLEKCETVTKYSTEQENQADTLAHAFVDIEEEVIKLQQVIPKLYMLELTAAEVDELIFEIGQQFEHIMYHIKDTKVYHYL